MSTLPLTFNSFAVPIVGNPVEPVTRTITSLQPDELLVRVEFSGINPMDYKLGQHNFFNLPVPVPLGFDFSGTVTAVGEEKNSDFQVGDAVYGFSTTGGCYAEYVKVNRAPVAKRGAIPAKEAGAYGIAYCSAYESLLIAENIKNRAGQTIYIAGGAGGVGHFAVQLAKLYGLTVITTSSKPASIELLKSLHADHIIDYSKQDVVKEILALTNGAGVDFAYDPSYSTPSFNQSAQVVKKGGTWMRLGTWERTADDKEARKIIESRGAVAVFGDLGRYFFDPAFVGKLGAFADALKEAVKLYEEGKVRPHIGEVVPFEQKALADAIEANGKGKLSTGKAVVQVAK